MTTSQTPFLAELLAGHSGPPLPLGKRAYFQQRLRIRVFNFLLEKFVQAQKKGLNKNILAKRIGRPPEVVNRWLGAPSNLTLDSISDLLLGISAEELELGTSSPINQVESNYSHFDDLASASAQTAETEEFDSREVVSAMSAAHLIPRSLRRYDASTRINAQENAYRNKAVNE
jgi:hypothetical protein